MNLNKVIVAGRLTADPEVKSLSGGTVVCNFNVAMNRSWKSEGGEKKEEVCFIGVKCFGPKASAVSKYFKKGNNILVEGYLRQETWEKDGKKNSKHVVQLESFSFVDKKPASSENFQIPSDDDSIPF